MIQVSFEKAALLSLAIVAGCDAGSVQSNAAPCVDAQAHVDACGVDVQLPDACDAEGAQAILDADCETLGEGGKADGCNPFFWWTCTGSEPEPTGIRLTVQECTGDAFFVHCDAVVSTGSCVRVRVEDAAGTVVFDDLTGSGGHLEIEALAPGDYTLEVLTRGDRVASMVDGEPFADGNVEMPARFEVTLAEGDQPRLDAYFKPGVAADELMRCAGAEVMIEGSCDGTPLSPEGTEWSWFAVFENEDTGERVGISRGLTLWDEDTQSQHNAAYVRGLRPGRYSLDVHLMDIPSWARRINPDYAALLGDYSEGVVYSKPFEVTLDDATQELDLGTVALDRTCE